MKGSKLNEGLLRLDRYIGAGSSPWIGVLVRVVDVGDAVLVHLFFLLQGLGGLAAKSSDHCEGDPGIFGQGTLR